MSNNRKRWCNWVKLSLSMRWPKMSRLFK